MNDRKNYRLEGRPIGIGGQAEVFRGIDKTTGGVIAFKRVLNNSDVDAVARMRREISVQLDLSHPNVMPILDSSLHFHWYTMPFAAETLEHLAVPVEDSLLVEIIEDVARGLQAAHAKRYVHRDLKPSNILRIDLSDSLRWVVSDWGLVRKHGKTSQIRTPPGSEFGTAAFAAPEMWRKAHDADERADIYSLGRVACWCVGKDVELLPNVQVEVDGVWREFVAKATMPEEKDRPQSIQDVLSLLKQVKRLLAIPRTTPGVSLDGNCPTCGYSEYNIIGFQEGWATQVRRCKQCGSEYRYFTYG